MTSAWPISVAGNRLTTDRSVEPTLSSGPNQADAQSAALLDRLTHLVSASGVDPSTAVAGAAEALARSYETSLAGAGLRLMADPPDSQLVSAVEADIARVGATASPDLLGRLYERLLGAQERSRRGTHLTSLGIARRLVACLDPGWLGPQSRDQRGHPSPRDGDDADKAAATVLDPAVGGAAFLIAAADAMVAKGWSAHEAWQAQRGVDIDATAVAVAEAALGLWLCSRGEQPRPHPGLLVGDGLLDPLPEADVIVGNPPFLNQLRRGSAASAGRRRALKERWGDLIKAYTDEAWLFMAAGIETLRPGGQLALVQPVSVLAAQHGSAIRQRVQDQADLTGLWVANSRVFEANVQVCAPILRRHVGQRSASRVRRWSGADFDSEATCDPVGPDGWGRAGAVLVGMPSVSLSRGAGTIADLATATAGFRDQFYGFAPHVFEADDAATNSAAKGALERLAPLVTVGMIDPARLRWGTEQFRFAGQRWTSPCVDLAALDKADPTLWEWTIARSRPKVLVATQTRIIEAWVDEGGSAVPATPTISVEPNDTSSVELYRVAAALMSPVISADRAAAGFGTAMSVGALKVAARDLLNVGLPSDKGAWATAAELVRSLHHKVPTDQDIRELGEVLYRCHGRDVEAHREQLISWWAQRWPIRAT